MATPNRNAMHTSQATDAPFTNQDVLRSCLRQGAKTGRDEEFEGDFATIWKLVRILHLHDHQLQEILQKKPEEIHPIPTGPSYDPLAPTLGTYVIYNIVTSTQAIRHMNQLLTTASQGYMITVVRDSFLWLDERVPYSSSWVGLLAPNTHDYPSKKRFLDNRDWLASERPEKFANGEPDVQSLTKDENTRLNELWNMFDGNEQVPVRIAFDLARLEVAGPWPAADAWPRYREIIALMPRVD
ncbi:hypothetical protein BJX61DRAFT_191352 [Aspergillus egyptiacus]|nr:hypothetical protein BJX61DRAFT_191352 [Aspergillus egyptiacus]